MKKVELYNQKLHHLVLGLITGLSLLSINFLILFFGRFSQFGFSSFLVCLVIPLSILFFSLGQTLKNVFSNLIFKNFILTSLLIFPFFYFYSYYFINHQELKYILLFVNSSLLFSGLGGMVQALDSYENFKINNYLNLGKLIGIIVAIILVPIIGYIFIFYLAFFIFMFFFFKRKKYFLLITIIFYLFINKYGVNYFDQISFNTFNQMRLEQDSNHLSSGAFNLNSEKPKFFWNLRGIYTLLTDKNQIENWAHNFVLEFKQNYSYLTLNARKVIYQQFESNQNILVLGAGGGASLNYFKNLSKNIHLVDRDCTALDVFKKTNENLNKVKISCLDASQIKNDLLNQKFDLISLESSVSQSLKTQLPFLSPFNLLTIETLTSFKTMLHSNGIFMFELNRVNQPQRKIIFEAALFNLNSIYNNHCEVIDDVYLESNYIGYILCSQDKKHLNNFISKLSALRAKNVSLSYKEINLNLKKNTPFLYVNNFLITVFGYNYLLIFFILFCSITLILLKKTSKNSYLIIYEGASTVQFYSLIYLLGSFFKNEIYSYLLVSFLSYLIYYFSIEKFKTFFAHFKSQLKYACIYLFLIISTLYLCQTFDLSSSTKVFLVILTLSILFLFNSIVFSKLVFVNLLTQKNSNIAINNSYVISVLIALVAIFSIGINATFILSSYVVINIGTALYKQADNP